MTKSSIIQEALAVAWIERTKGGHRAADVIEQLLEEVRRLREAERQEHRRDALRAAMREDVEAVRKLIHGEGPRFVIGEKLE